MMQTFFFIMVGAYAFGALSTAVSGRSTLTRWFTALGAGVGSVAALILGGQELWTGQSTTFDRVAMLPLTGMALRIDGLSAVFLIIIGLVGLAVAVYSFGYTAAYDGRYSLRMLGALLNLLLLSLALLVLADNAFTFLFMWEVMSLSSYWLVLTEADQPGTMRAGAWYSIRLRRTNMSP